jgi:hypothetical protein
MAGKAPRPPKRSDNFTQDLKNRTSALDQQAARIEAEQDELSRLLRRLDMGKMEKNVDAVLDSVTTLSKLEFKIENELVDLFNKVKTRRPPEQVDAYIDEIRRRAEESGSAYETALKETFRASATTSRAVLKASRRELETLKESISKDATLLSVQKQELLKMTDTFERDVKTRSGLVRRAAASTLEAFKSADVASFLLGVATRSPMVALGSELILNRRRKAQEAKTAAQRDSLTRRLELLKSVETDTASLKDVTKLRSDDDDPNTPSHKNKNAPKSVPKHPTFGDPLAQKPVVEELRTQTVLAKDTLSANRRIVDLLEDSKAEQRDNLGDSALLAAEEARERRAPRQVLQKDPSQSIKEREKTGTGGFFEGLKDTLLTFANGLGLVGLTKGIGGLLPKLGGVAALGTPLAVVATGVGAFFGTRWLMEKFGGDKVVGDMVDDFMKKTGITGWLEDRAESQARPRQTPAISPSALPKRPELQGQPEQLTPDELYGANLVSSDQTIAPLKEPIQTPGDLYGPQDLLHNQRSYSLTPFARPTQERRTNQARPLPAVAAGMSTLGDFTSAKEAGSGDVHKRSGVINSVKAAKGDLGGHSYGAFQFASNVGTIERFLKFADTHDPEIAKELRAAGGDKGARQRSPQFVDTWRKWANRDPKRFYELQRAFALKDYYEPAVKNIKKLTGVDITERSAAIREQVLATAIQFGSRAPAIFQRALEGAGTNAPDETLLHFLAAEKTNQFTAGQMAAVRKGQMSREAAEQQIAANTRRYSNEVVGLQAMPPSDPPTRVRAAGVIANASHRSSDTQQSGPHISAVNAPHITQVNQPVHTVVVMDPSARNTDSTLNRLINPVAGN